MTFEEQAQTANETVAFIEKYGLKSNYVAEKTNIKYYLLSRFINHKLVLTEGQLTRLKSFMTDYNARMA